MPDRPPVGASGPAAAVHRAALSETALRDALIQPGSLWRDVRVVTQTGSTNADLLAEAGNGAPQGLVLAAESQTAGRGRMGRRWYSPPRAALTFSVLLRPGDMPPASRGWVPLLAGVAVAGAIRAETGLDARLKWPNDVLVSGAKVAGILAEQCADAIVLGTGINVSASQREIPAPGATSLALAGAAGLDRERLLARVLAGMQRWYLAWTTAAPGAARGDAGACGLRPEYLRLSATIGRAVRVDLPGGQVLTGTAQDVDEAGRLVVRAASGLVPVSAGDVIHLR
jgi:BirA family transcriptional regulator, biotin operon repressor / biotin---[acetyl-CoA-carboxylase] ligase